MTNYLYNELSVSEAQQDDTRKSLSEALVRLCGGAPIHRFIFIEQYNHAVYFPFPEYRKRIAELAAAIAIRAYDLVRTCITRFTPGHGVHHQTKIMPRGYSTRCRDSDAR
jgi:hypothetical protein